MSGFEQADTVRTISAAIRDPTCAAVALGPWAELVICDLHGSGRSHWVALRKAQSAEVALRADTLVVDQWELRFVQWDVAFDIAAVLIHFVSLGAHLDGEVFKIKLVECLLDLTVLGEEIGEGRGDLVWGGFEMVCGPSRIPNELFAMLVGEDLPGLPVNDLVAIICRAQEVDLAVDLEVAKACLAIAWWVDNPP